MVSLEPSARAKRLKTELPRLLRELEISGLTELRPSRASARGHFAEVARKLGVASAGQGATDFPGSIYITIQLPTERAGGFVADTGDALPTWVSEFLRAPKRRDVLDKLARSGRSERHAFIWLMRATVLRRRSGHRGRRSRSPATGLARAALACGMRAVVMFPSLPPLAAPWGASGTVGREIWPGVMATVSVALARCRPRLVRDLLHQQQPGAALSDRVARMRRRRHGEQTARDALR